MSQKSQNKVILLATDGYCCLVCLQQRCNSRNSGGDSVSLAGISNFVKATARPPHSMKTTLRLDKTLRRFFLGVGQVFFVGALEIFDFSVFEVPDAGGHFVDYVVIVRYEQNGAVVLLQRDV